MTPGRLYLFALLSLILAGLLIFAGSDTILVNVLGCLATLLALVAYLLGLYLARVGRRGETALEELRDRISQATKQEIDAEHRVYHREGLEGVPSGELVIFYRTASGWLLVPLLDDLSWIEVRAEDVGLVQIDKRNAERGVSLHVEFKTASGKELRLLLTSTLLDPSRQTINKVQDLIDLKDALRESAAS